MDIRADILYKALKSLGRVPKTYKIQDVTICTDIVTGKTRKESETTAYALVGIIGEGRKVAVDFLKLKEFSRKMGKEMLDVTVGYGVLKVSYPNGNFILLDTKATTTVELDLDTIEHAVILV